MGYVMVYLHRGKTAQIPPPKVYKTKNWNSLILKVMILIAKYL